NKTGSTTDTSLPPNAAFKVWDAKTGAELDAGGRDGFQRTFGVSSVTPTMAGGQQQPLRVESADGRLLATVDANGPIRVRWAANQNLIAELPTRGNRVWLLRFASDGKHLLWVDDDEVLRIAALPPQPRELSSTWDAPSEVMALAAVPGSESLVSAQSDGYVRIWDLSTGREFKKFRFTSTPIKQSKNSFALSPDGASLAVVEPDGVRVVEVATGQERYRLPNLRP